MPAGPLSTLTSLAVSDLLEHARRGALRPVLAAARGAWDDRRRTEFLDSLGRGFPAGALVLAPGVGGAAEVRLGRWALAAPAVDDVLWVVDGQQRLGALAEILRTPGPGEPRAEVELSSPRVVLARPGDDRQGELPGLGASDRVPLAVALDLPALLRWRRLHPIEDDALARVLAWAEGLRRARLPVYRLTTDDPATVADARERANGTTLDALDREALRRDPTAGDPERLARSLAGLGFGLLDPETVRRAVRALPPADDASRWRHASAALRRAIVFTQVNGGIPHVALLPHAAPLAVLARFFHLFPQPGPAAREALRQWLWRGTLALAPGGPTGRHLDAIREGDEDGSARRLLALAPVAPAPDLLALERLHVTHARSRMQLCALASLHPREPSGGTPVDLGALLTGDELPGAALVEAPGHPLAGTLAARVLLPRQGPAPLAARLLAASPEERASHGLDEAATAALRAGDPSALLAARAALLVPVLARFFARQADWVDPAF